jgi:2'-5' RNA ligase
MPEHKVFFAVRPEPAAAAQMAALAAALARRHGLGGRPTPRERLHLSLSFVGVFKGPPPAAVVEKARAAAATVAAQPFRLALNRVDSWKGDPRPLVLTGEEGVIGVEVLQGQVQRALALAGMAPRRAPPFWAHVTLLRDEREAPSEHVEPIAWTVREFVLLDSVAGEGRQDLLARFPLPG